MQESAPLSSLLPAALSLEPGLSTLDAPPPAATRVLAAAALLAGSRQVVIDHDGKLYRLSLTKNNRLILQK